MENNQIGMRYKKKFVKRETQEKFYFWTMFVQK